ncbi:hypothetical protein CF326_g8407, partial [Tilletia indica]
MRGCGLTPARLTASSCSRRRLHTSSSTAARVLSAVPHPPSSPSASSSLSSGGTAAATAAASRLWSKPRKSRSGHGNPSPASSSSATTAAAIKNATLARARARAQLLIKLGIEPSSALRATGVPSRSAPSQPISAPTPVSTPTPAPTPAVGRGRKTLKTLRKAKMVASIGGINLASVRAGALASGLGLSPGVRLPPPPTSTLTPTPAATSGNKTHTYGRTSTNPQKQKEPNVRFPTRMERAAQNAKAVELATRAVPLMTYIDPSLANRPSAVENEPAPSPGKSESDSLLWNLVSSVLARGGEGVRDDAYPSRKEQEEGARGAFTQNYPSSASLIDSSRQGQHDEDETEQHPSSSTTTVNNRNNQESPHQTHLREGILNSHAPPFFELLPLHLPADYPPPTPRIPDMEMRALALGVNHLAGDDVGPDSAWVLEKPARLEYLGDSVLELATRTLIFREVADLSPKTMAILKSHLVSNDILGHLYNQAGLETLRLDTAEWALETLRTQHPKSAIGPPPLHPSFSHTNASLLLKRRPSATSGTEDPEETRRRRLSLYLPDLPHSRKADLFEAYLGALYLSQPPSIASEWVQNLLRPFAARAMRHELMGLEEALTRAGVVRRICYHVSWSPSRMPRS